MAKEKTTESYKERVIKKMTSEWLQGRNVLK
jgi:hypothetical protein